MGLGLLLLQLPNHSRRFYITSRAAPPLGMAVIRAVQTPPWPSDPLAPHLPSRLPLVLCPGAAPLRADAQASVRRVVVPTVYSSFAPARGRHRHASECVVLKEYHCCSCGEEEEQQQRENGGAVVVDREVLTELEVHARLQHHLGTADARSLFVPPRAYFAHGLLYSLRPGGHTIPKLLDSVMGSQLDDPVGSGGSGSSSSSAAHAYLRELLRAVHALHHVGVIHR
jgi:serine/threonine protein kinase